MSVGFYTRNNHDVKAVQFSEGNRRDILGFLESLGSILWIRYSLTDEFDVLSLDNAGEVIRTYKDCYLVVDGENLTVMSKDEFEENYTPVVKMVGPAPLADSSYGAYYVDGNYPDVLQPGASYNLELATLSPIKRHLNGNGVDGYWCGFYCVPADGSTTFSYKKDVGYDPSIIDGEGWTELPVEKNVDGKGNDGVAFYFDKESVGDKKAYIALRFGSMTEDEAYKFTVDLSRVDVI